MQLLLLNFFRKYKFTIYYRYIVNGQITRLDILDIIDGKHSICLKIKWHRSNKLDSIIKNHNLLEFIYNNSAK